MRKSKSVLFMFDNGSMRFGNIATLAILTSCYSSSAQAQGLRITEMTIHHAAGAKITKKDLKNAPNPTVYDSPTYFQDAVNAAWRSGKAKADKAITLAIGQANLEGKFPSGVNLYHQMSSLSQQGTLQTTAFSDHLLLTYNLTRNYLEFTSTTPSMFGKYGDPRLSLTYDLSIAITIPLNAATRSLQVSSAIATVSNVSRPDTHNMAGDLEKGVVLPIFRFFGGADFLAEVQKQITGKQFDLTNEINGSLGPVNDAIGKIVGRGFSILSASNLVGKPQLVLTGSKIIADPAPSRAPQPKA